MSHATGPEVCDSWVRERTANVFRIRDQMRVDLLTNAACKLLVEDKPKRERRTRERRSCCNEQQRAQHGDEPKFDTWQPRQHAWQA